MVTAGFALQTDNVPGGWRKFRSDADPGRSTEQDVARAQASFARSAGWRQFSLPLQRLDEQREFRRRLTQAAPPRALESACESVADQPPDRPHIRNTQNYAPNFSAISVTSKKRTKSRSHQLWRERAVERAKRPVGRRTQSSGPARKARRYWASDGPVEAGETCCLGSIGGGLVREEAP